MNSFEKTLVFIKKTRLNLYQMYLVLKDLDATVHQSTPTQVFNTTKHFVENARLDLSAHKIAYNDKTKYNNKYHYELHLNKSIVLKNLPKGYTNNGWFAKMVFKQLESKTK